jgi:hypothetical protein
MLSSSIARHPSNNVRYACIDGNAVLLDIAGGDYLILTKTETAMWRALTQLQAHERIDALIQQFDVPRSVVDADLASFDKMCLQRDYLTEDPPPALTSKQISERSSQAALAAWIWMLRVSQALRRSFKDAYDLCLSLRKPLGCRMGTELHQAEKAFLQAENFFMHKGAPKDCLPRSLSLYGFLTSAGYDVTHVIGVLRFPFEAHAWVEHDGKVLLDRPEWVNQYTSLARI